MSVTALTRPSLLAVTLGDVYEVLHRHMVNAEQAVIIAERDAMSLSPGIRKVMALATMASMQARAQYLAGVIDALEHDRPVPELGG